MKQVFSIGTKLLGVYFIFAAVTSLFGLIASLASIYNQGNFLFQIEGLGDSARVTWIFFIATLFQLAFGFIALQKTEIFVELARLPDLTIPSLNTKDIFKTGIMLIGVFVFVENIGFVLNNFFLWFFRNNLPYTDIDQTQSWADFLKILFAFSLILFSNQITKLLVKTPADESNTFPN